MIFVELKKNHLPEVVALSNVVFGKDFLDENYLYRCLSTPEKYNIAVLESNIVIGFLLADILTYHEFVNDVSSEKKWFKEHFNSYKTICLIKQIAIHPNYQKKNIASQLISNILKITATKFEIACCLAWIKGKETPLTGILIRNGFKQKITLENYWYKESIMKDYNCIICGVPPCSCSVAVFTK